jgi:hypothetical protein
VLLSGQLIELSINRETETHGKYLCVTAYVGEKNQ